MNYILAYLWTHTHIHLTTTRIVYLLFVCTVPLLTSHFQLFLSCLSLHLLHRLFHFLFAQILCVFSMHRHTLCVHSARAYMHLQRIVVTMWWWLFFVFSLLFVAGFFPSSSSHFQTCIGIFVLRTVATYSCDEIYRTIYWNAYDLCMSSSVRAYPLVPLDRL